MSIILPYVVAAMMSLIEIFTGLKNWLITNTISTINKWEQINFLASTDLWKFFYEFVFYIVVILVARQY